MSDELTDRDRLAMAFDDLRMRGYIADVSIGYRMCCRDCALHEIARMGDVRDEDDDLVLPDRFVFWHMMKDDYSFADCGGGFPLSDELLAKGHEWLSDEDSVPEIEAYMLGERTSNYVWLINPLNLHWMGNADEIVGVLRNHGLRCDVPNSDHWCIEVQPTRVRDREEQDA